MGQSQVAAAQGSPGQSQVLNLAYWQRMLPQVYDASHANQVVTMLADGARVGRPGALRR